MPGKVVKGGASNATCDRSSHEEMGLPYLPTESKLHASFCRSFKIQPQHIHPAGPVNIYIANCKIKLYFYLPK